MCLEDQPYGTSNAWSENPSAGVESAPTTATYQCAEATLCNLVIRRSWRDRQGHLVVRHFCADKGYDYAEVRQVAHRLGYRVHIGHRRRRGEPEPPPVTGRRHPARQWVIERTHSWHNRFRALKIRWEKKLRITQPWFISPVRSLPLDFWDRL